MWWKHSVKSPPQCREGVTEYLALQRERGGSQCGSWDRHGATATALLRGEAAGGGACRTECPPWLGFPVAGPCAGSPHSPVLPPSLLPSLERQAWDTGGGPVWSLAGCRAAPTHQLPPLLAWPLSAAPLSTLPQLSGCHGTGSIPFPSTGRVR